MKNSNYSNFKLIVVSLLFYTLLFSCKSPDKDSGHTTSIIKIENNLIPSIMYEGKEVGDYSIHDRMKHYNVPGLSITFFDEGEIKWSRCYGFLEKDSITPVNENTLFQAASISKPIAAAGVLRMVESGLVELDKNVNDYISGWKISENLYTDSVNVTLRHLVTHTGGLTVHGFRGYAEGEDIPTIEQILNGKSPANSSEIKLDTFPNSIWRYSGGGYTILQKVMVDVQGLPFHLIMRDNVLSKAGMQNSTYEQPLPKHLHQNAAIGHRNDGEIVKGNWHTYPEQAAAGLWTTPSDLARFAIDVQRSFTGREDPLLSQEMAIKMLTKHKGDWGLGFALNGDADSLRFGHGGANEGYRCNLFAFADLGPGVAIMTNGDNGGNLVGEILKSMSKEYEWNIFNPDFKNLVNLSYDELLKFAGVYIYEPDNNFTIEIIVDGDKLLVTQRWDEQSYHILPEDIETFFEENDGTPFHFNSAENGDIAKVLVSGEFELIKIE